MKSLTDLAGNLDISTEQVLTSLRIVATRAGVEELAKWAARELEGYEEEDELPTHRSWRLTIVASLHNPMQGFIESTHVGDFAIDEQHREKATTYYCRDGVGQIEHLLSSQGNDDRSHALSVEHPNLAQLINRGPMLHRGWTCTHAAAEFSPMHLRTIVNKARQTALRLCLECENKGLDLQYEADDCTTPQDRKAWIDTLKQEGTKLIIRDVWTAVRTLAMGE